jgi:hypothetical protein
MTRVDVQISAAQTDSVTRQLIADLELLSNFALRDELNNMQLLFT